MPIIKSGDCPINVDVSGPDGAPVLMLSNSLGTTMRMWEPQLDTFNKRFKVVRFDRRGHGGSGVTNGDYTFEMLARDALAVADGLGIQTFSWCGLSMGGMEGMWLGAKAGNRLDKLILSNTSAFFEDKAMWNARMATVREKGLATIVGPNMERWFTKDFRDRSPDTIKWFTDMFLTTTPDGYLGCSAAVRDMDHRGLLVEISTPTLVIAGRHDPATNLAAGEFIRDRIPGAKLTVLEAAHISNVERAEEYSSAVVGFLTQ
jgi:3-oxoadipate enol-lactonase